MSRARAALILALLLSGFATVAASPSPSPPLPPDLYLGRDSTPALTATLAGRVVKAWWPLHERALASNDITMTDALEAGSAREFDDAVSRDNIVLGVNLRIVREYTDFRVMVPWQYHLPAYFLAEVATTVYGTTNEYPQGTAYTEILVFTRANQSAPWVASLRTGHTIPFFDEITWFKRDFETYDMPPPKPGWISPTDVPGKVAAYWSYCYEHGKPAHEPFVQGYWTTEFCPRLKSEHVQESGLGINTTGNYYVDLKRDGFWEFNVYDGWDFACFAVRVKRQLTPAFGLGSLRQDTRRNNYGGWLAPGKYRVITDSILHQSCALIPPTASGTPQFPGIGIVGGDGGIVDVTGVSSTGLAQSLPGALSPLVLLLIGIFAALLIGALVFAGVAVSRDLSMVRSPPRT